MLKFLAILCLLLFSTFAVCIGQISQLAPAVVGESGELVNISMEGLVGTGKIYVAVSPRVGVATQESLEQAVDYSYFLSQRQKDCDFVIRFDGPSIDGFVDGPSAGAAFAVMSYALLNNYSLRTDTVITGAADRFGNVAPVGGIYEKAKTAAAKGANYFITPVGSVYETLLLKNIERQTGIKTLQAKKVDDIIGFMIFNRTIQESQGPQNRTIPSLPVHNDPTLASFVPISRQMLALESQAISSLPADDNDTRAVRDFFNNELNRQKSIFESGYLFGVANEAFLNYIDLLTIKAVYDSSTDVGKKKAEIQTCLSQVSRPAIKSDNFEWVIGSDLRVAWAQDRLNRTIPSDRPLVEERLMKYNQILYAHAWCQVAKVLSSSAPSSGYSINESDWYYLASDYLSLAKNNTISDEELRSRINTAESSFRAGRYGSSIYDSIYVISMQTAMRDLTTTNDDKIKSIVVSSINDSRTSLWAKLYQSQAKFLYFEGDYRNAYRLLIFSKNLDTIYTKLLQGVVRSEGKKENISRNFISQDSGFNPFFFALVFLVAAIVVFVLKLRGRVHGNKLQRRNGFYRAKQEKG